VWAAGDRIDLEKKKECQKKRKSLPHLRRKVTVSFYKEGRRKGGIFCNRPRGEKTKPRVIWWRGRGLSVVRVMRLERGKKGRCCVGVGSPQWGEPGKAWAPIEERGKREKARYITTQKVAWQLTGVSPAELRYRFPAKRGKRGKKGDTLAMSRKGTQPSRPRPKAAIVNDGERKGGNLSRQHPNRKTWT